MPEGITNNKDIFDQIWERKFAFFGTFMVILTVTYSILFAIDFIPETPETDDTPTKVVAEVEPEVIPEEEPFAGSDPLPKRIIIDELNKDVTIVNPQSRAIADLDEALLDGVVRHPDSADFEKTGNMFLFGHSSYLPTVHNRNFQAFNGIQDLEWGDMIRVQSGDAEYVYRVQKVYKTAASVATILLDDSKAKLTLATCNSFGAKDDRFIVEADLVDSYPLEAK